MVWFDEYLMQMSVQFFECCKHFKEYNCRFASCPVCLLFSKQFALGVVYCSTVMKLHDTKLVYVFVNALVIQWWSSVRCVVGWTFMLQESRTFWNFHWSYDLYLWSVLKRINIFVNGVFKTAQGMFSVKIELITQTSTPFGIHRLWELSCRARTTNF